MKNKKSNLKVLIFYVVLIAAIILALSLMFTNREDNSELKNYSEVVDYFRADAVKEFTVTENNYITMSVYDKAEIEKIKTKAEVKAY